MNQEPNQEDSLTERGKRIISFCIGTIAVIFTGDPEGFSKDKKTKDL